MENFYSFRSGFSPLQERGKTCSRIRLRFGNRAVFPIRLIPVLLLLLILGSAPGSPAAARPPEEPQRIISMSPAITEILFAIGAGPRVAGVTDFCKYPREATRIPRVGGILNPSYETMVSLHPDLIIHQNHSRSIAKHASQLGIAALSVNLTSLDNILQSIIQMGDALGERAGAKNLHQKILRKIEFYRSRLKDRPRKSVLLVFDSDRESLRDMYAVAKGTFLDELLTLAGGENILTDRRVPYPKISKEFVIKRSPEIIIELYPSADPSVPERAQSREEWRRFPTIQAVRENRIHFIGADYILLPGPRLIKIIDRFARVIHPELFPEVSAPARIPEGSGS